MNETGSALCAIENKVFSSEHSEQLTRYRRALAERYPDFTRHHVFLTPGGIDAHLEEERRFWVPAAYATVLDIVQQESMTNAIRRMKTCARFCGSMQRR